MTKEPKQPEEEWGYDAIVAWSDLGRPTEVGEYTDVKGLPPDDYVLVEQEHLDQARRLIGEPSDDEDGHFLDDPRVLIKNITAEIGDPGCLIQTWSIVDIMPEYLYP